ncbi:methenyltetrahydrofolate cyclohydrolase FchA [Methyloglobulus morosus KoM1]|uniref:Methenyltetrahydrofolate cyclohydrolase FchA n=1 Tax=Methyloglobulus morosus KoM1 TaxID=1116472 RepID=V5B084_9GAMM|nr:methenyltetrahydrofolate cyclohydrolase [Methyloglobulus morosus]ESS66525.1 methenyltetrahydrofolate cyclohydrolase FchA [Methyloglobulus morosus KoM1]
MTEIKNQSIQQFLTDLASKSATPGGGSAAALMGAQGAALVSMVCNLTIGKPKFAEVETEMQDVLEQAETLRAQLTDLIKADIDVFNQLMSQYALPKESDDEKATRSAAIQDVLKDATEVPLQCVQACAEVIRLSKIAAELGNPGAVSDAGAAVMAAYGGLKSSALNVYINVASLKDKAFVETKLAELEQATKNIEHLVDTVYQIVKTRL